MINKIICFLAVVILFLFFVGTSLNLELVNAQNSPADLLNQGKSLVNHGMPNEAILIYDEFLRKDPNNVSALIEKGIALKHLQKFEEARNFLDAALKLEPDNVYAKVERLDVLRYLKDHDEIRRSSVEILGPNLEKIEYFDNPSCFSCFGYVPFLHPMRDTDDYIGSVHFEMRDSNDNLVGVVESDLIWYPAHPVFDNSLSQYPVSRMLEKDGSIYEMRKFIVNYNVSMEKQPAFLSSLAIYGEVEGADVIFLTTWNFGIAIEEGDYIIAEYEIGKKI
jgi:tetratricopeptide (TPR) repeat protein